ncbi:hypothetical protein J4407_00825 [Candidatus Pacearchaeota archaeon]|nr:hypothetical protein [Candidatus Pacearchaeota archaeon]
MKKKIFILFLVFSIALLSFLRADIFSINSGGGNEIIIDSFVYGEGGVFSCVPQTCSEFGFNCGTYVEFCGTTLSCGSCASGFTCTSNVCVAVPAAPSEEETGSGAGGGGGGGTFVTSGINFGDLIVTPAEVSVSAIQGIEEQRELILRNNGQLTIFASLEVFGEDIRGIVELSEATSSIRAGEEKIIILTINSESKELLTGKILVRYSGYTKEVPVVIGTKTENFLFDISVFISDTFKKITPGNRINAQFNLIEVGLNEKVDVVATYIIKDFEGNSYYEESETFFVQDEKTYSKEFNTENLEAGKYVLGFGIEYPGAFAISSSTFEISKPFLGLNLITIIIIIILLVGIVFVVWISRRIILRNRLLRKYKSK